MFSPPVDQCEGTDKHVQVDNLNCGQKQGTFKPAVWNFRLPVLSVRGITYIQLSDYGAKGAECTSS